MNKEKVLYIWTILRTSLLGFFLSGGPGALVYILVLYSLTEYLQWWYVVSAIVARVLNMTLNFIIQKNVVFKNYSYNKKQYWNYFHVSIDLITINTIGLLLLTEYLGIAYLVAQLIITAPQTWLAHKLIKPIFTQ